MNSIEKRLHVPWLDGLRGLAILLVVMHHFFDGYYLFTVGWVGVNLFFILSGYLITGRLLCHMEQDGGRHFFRNFYGRRVLRIFPLYYGTLVVFFMVLPVFYSRYFYFFHDLYRDQWWYWSYLSNWQTVLYGMPANGMLITFWSLAVEEQFYLVWPFIFRYTERLNRKTIILILWGVSIVCRVWAKNTMLSYFSTLTAAEPLLMGALLILLEKEGRLGYYRRVVAVMSVCAMAVLSFVVWKDHDLTFRNAGVMRWGYTCIDVLLAALLYVLVAPGGGVAVRRLFSSGWLRWLGKYSYGIYVYHGFIMQMLVFKCQAILVGRGMQAGPVYFLTRAGGIVLLLVCSYGSYYLFEKQFLRLKKYFT